MSMPAFHPFFSTYQRLLGTSFAKVGLRSPASETFTGNFLTDKKCDDGTDSLRKSKKPLYSNIFAFRGVDWSLAKEVAHPLIRLIRGELYRLRVKVGYFALSKPSTRAKIAALSTGQYSSPQNLLK